MSEANEKLLEKIRLLLAKANRTDNEHEAETFFAAAQKLMVRHAIDQSMLGDSDKDRDKIIVHGIAVKKRDEIRMAKALMIHGIAKANRCQIILCDNEVKVIGYESDAQFTELLFSSVLIQYAGERNRAWTAYTAKTPKPYQQSRYLWVNAFAQAYAVRVEERLQEMAEKAEAAESAPGTALALRDRSQDVADHVARNFRVKSKSVAMRGGHGTAAGREAANKADLSGGRNNLRGRRAIGR